ncbi:MAG: VWA domain-containing protein [Fimbriimonadales bacterium]
MIRFAEPIYLLLFIPAAIGLWLSFRHVHGMMRGRKIFAFVLRALLAACLIFALAAPEARRPNVGLSAIFVVDRSDSISDTDKKAAIEYINSALEELRPQDEAGVIAFGSDAAIEIAPSNLRKFSRIMSVTNGGGTDLAAAIRLASASHSDGKSKRIIVLSDGNETQGEAVEAASVAQIDNVQIDYVALGNQQTTDEAAVLDLSAPTEIALSQTFDLRATIDSTKNTEAILRLDRDGVVAKETSVKLSTGRSQILISDVIDKPGFHRYRATLTAKNDTDVRNNVGSTFVTVRGRPHVLVIQQNHSSRLLAQAIREQGIIADVFGPSGMPTRVDEFQNYDAVIFNDVNAASMTAQQMKLLGSAVKDTGIGFAMIGGENSFLPGGWYGTPVADVLPVDLDIRQRKTFPSTSMLIVVDASGSMSMIEDGVEKIRLAAKAAETTVNLMAPRDRIGVAGSTDGIEFVAPMQQADDKTEVISQVRKLSTGGGGIYCRPSMRFAQTTLEAEKSKVRHLILLADGADCDQQEECIPIAIAMRAQKITTSVVAIGDGEHVPFLKRLATAGGGKYYLARKAGQLPAIFTQDAAVMSRSAIEEGVFLPKSVIGEEILRGIEPNSIPALYAYCLASDRPLAQTGMRTAKDDPLLATWQYGLGTTLAFTSDAQARWAAKWVTWQQFGAFWAQAVRVITRRTTQNEYQLATRQDGGKGILDVKAYDRFGNPLNSINAKVRVSTPEGNSLEVALSQQAPGLYRGEFAANELGTYVVTIAEDGGKRVSTAGFSVPYPPEYKRFRSNTPLLERMSKATGGMALTKPEDVARPVPSTGFSITPLWALFALLAALLLPLDVAARRIAVPVGALAKQVVDRLKRRERVAPATDLRVERLQKAKQRAHDPQPAPAEAPAATDLAKEPASAATRLLDAKRRRGG